MRTSLDLPSILGIPNLSEHLERVDQELLRAIETDNPYITRPVHRLLASRGKRLRPTMVIAVALSQGAAVDQGVISSCVAIELVHIASLIHDDIIDSADTRWGLPTISSKEGTSHAIVIGDYLLGKACSVAASVSADAALGVSNAITALCEGQSYELADEYNLDRSIQTLLKATRGKTGALLAASCQVGGLCAQLSLTQTDPFFNYGEQFGMAFQLIDDVLDLVSTPELAGKPIGGDITEGVYTLPLLLGLRGPHSDKLRNWIKKGYPTHRDELVATLIQDGSMRETIAEAQEYGHQATRSLAKLNSDTVIGLSNLPDAYIQWSLTKMVAKQYRLMITLPRA